MDILKVLRKNNLQLFKDEIEKDESLLYVKDSFGSNLLHKAIFWKCNIIVNYLKDNSKLRNETDDDGYTVYHKAALSKNIDAIEILGLDEKAAVKNNFNEIPLITAVKMKSTEIIQKLLRTIPDTDEFLKLSEKSPAIIKYYLNKKMPIREPRALYIRDDLEDPYTLENITPGTLYAFRMDNRSNYYCLGSAETVDTMLKNKYKSSNETMVFDMIQNTTVSIDSILFSVKNECPSVIKKIFNKTFKEEDIDLEFKDDNYDGDSLLSFAKAYNNEDAIKLIEKAMKKD
jgi:ankyrin repeat protein